MMKQSRSRYLDLDGVSLVLIACNENNDRSPSNAEKAIGVLESLVSGDSAAAEAHVSGDTFIQHNPDFPDGWEALLGCLEQLAAAGVTVDVRRGISDGDYVVTHTSYDMLGPKIGFDIFPFEGGLIVEHWDNYQETHDGTANPHTMIDGPTTVTNRDLTDENKCLVDDFVTEVLIGGDFGAMVTYFDGDAYIQHNQSVPDGVSGLMTAMQEMATADVTMSYTTLHLVLGEGNFVLAVSEGSIDVSGVGSTPTAFYDLFRVENGYIAEHWDVIADIPVAEDWANVNGKF